MTQFEKWSLHLTVSLVTVTGTVYLLLKYGLEQKDPFSVVNHPLEPVMLKLHILAAPALIFLIGLVARSHILRKVFEKESANRRTGLLLMMLLVAMASSGYLLQVASDEGTRSFLIYLHVITGFGFTSFYAVHVIASLLRCLQRSRLRKQRMTHDIRSRVSRKGRTAASLVILGFFVAPVSDELAASSRNPDLPTEDHFVKREAFVMGTPVLLLIETANRKAGLDQLESILAILEKTEAELSTWRSDTLFGMLNESAPGRCFQLDPLNCRLFVKLRFWNQQTSGAFDPSLGNLTRAWDLRGEGRIASSSEIRTAKKASGLSHFDFNPESCLLRRRNGVRIDAGGFGKGEALDRVKNYSELNGLRSWIINFGGQILVSGPKVDGTPWEVVLTARMGGRSPALTISLTKGSLATSGNSRRGREVDGVIVGHLIDPASGRPAGFDVTCTVWHEEALVADILSTALFVMGPTQGLDWAEDHGIAVCYTIPDRRLGFRTRLSHAFESLAPRHLQ